MNARVPLGNEEARVRTLHSLRVLEIGEDPTLDGLVRTAARAANAPMALVSLVDADRHWFKARVGLEAKHIPRDAAFCTHAIEQDDTFVVEDAARDPRFASSPMVTGEPHVRFYAGIPLKVDHQAVGMLCVLDRQPRRLDAEVEAILKDIARAVEHWLKSCRAHELLRERESEFRQMAEHLPAVIYRAEAGPPHKFLYVSPRVAKLGGTPEQWIADPLARTRAIHPEDRERVLLDMTMSLAFGDHMEVDYRIRDAEGAWRHYLDVAQIIRSADGEAAYLQGAMFDVSERVGAESKAREALAYWHGLFAQLPDGILVVNAAHGVVEANPQAAAMLGYSTEELCRMNLRDLLEGTSDEMLADETRQVFDGQIAIAERRYRCRDGRCITIEARAGAPVDDRYVKVLRDITGRRAQEAQLRRLSEAVEQSSESIYVSDLQGNIEYVNAAGIATSGYSREELIGRNSRMLQSGKTTPSTYEAMWSCLKAGETWKGLLYNRNKQGVEYTEHTIISPIQDHTGRVTHFLSVKEDVTEKQRLSEELEQYRGHLEELVEKRTLDLQQAKRAAEAANDAKSAFLASMSHEIRTPMNGVVGLVDVLRQSSLTPYQSDLTDTIRESSFALLRIIDDILDFSKIEAGRLELEPEVVDLRHVIEHVCLQLEPMARERSVVLQVYIDPALPSTVHIDGVRLRQILNNLVGNAIKFSGRLERLGQVRVRALASGGNSMCIRVADNGIGIEPEASRHIFEPFVQGESSTTRRYGGTGLGLTICRRLVEMLGGNIAVSSVPGAGSTFTFELPLQVRDSGPRDPAHDLSGVECRVMLRDAQMAADWCAYLAAAHAVAWTDGNADAPDWSAPPAAGIQLVVITDDIENPAMLERQAQGTARETSVVSIEEGQRRNPRLRQPGLVCLDGPVLREDALLLAVSMATGRTLPAQDQWPVHAPAMQRATLSIEEAAAQGRLILVAEDNDINQKVILHQLALLGLAAELADNGVEALKLWRSGRYAMVLTDLHMPGLDGYELTRTIRREEAPGTHVPIIAISATTLHAEAERCFKAGLDDYISKPVQLDQLAQRMTRWLPSASLPPTLRMSVPAQPPSADIAPPNKAVVPFYDPAVLPRLVGADPQLLAEFCRDFMTSAQRAARQLRTAVAAADWRETCDVAHRMKSSARSVGLLGLGDCCERLEAAAQTPSPDAMGGLMTELADALDRADLLLSPARAGAMVPTVSMPPAQAIPAKPAAIAAPAPGPEAGQPWVVVIDDEPIQARLLTRQLKSLGVHAVHVCKCGADALQWLKGRDSSGYLVLLDLNMPEMDGVEVMRHLAEQQFAGSLVLVSGANERVLESAGRLAQAYELRVIAHLQKPATSEALDAAITQWRSGTKGGHVFRARRPRSVAEVRHAIEADQLVMHYQPMVALADGALVGVEALVRWQHPTDGLLGADAVVGIAEAHGMTDALTRRVLEKSLAQLKLWRGAGMQLRVAINVSMQNLTQLSFPEYVLGEVLRHGLLPPDLRLEVTESQLLSDARVPMDILTRLRLKRIGLSIDDFGTGHSSLSQLCNLPFDELKIDRGFVHASHQRATPRAIFDASLNMAHQLKMSAIAEGVEDRADWDFVRAAGCDFAQGYFIARPMPGDQLQAWSAEWNKKLGELL